MVGGGEQLTHNGPLSPLTFMGCSVGSSGISPSPDTHPCHHLELLAWEVHSLSNLSQLLPITSPALGFTLELPLPSKQPLGQNFSQEVSSLVPSLDSLGLSSPWGCRLLPLLLRLAVHPGQLQERRATCLWPLKFKSQVFMPWCHHTLLWSQGARACTSAAQDMSGGRVWRDAATSQGMPGATRSWTR